MAKPEVRKFLDLSTAHLPESLVVIEISNEAQNARRAQVSGTAVME